MATKEQMLELLDRAQQAVGNAQAAKGASIAPFLKDAVTNMKRLRELINKD